MSAELIKLKSSWSIGVGYCFCVASIQIIVTPELLESWYFH